jgi:predicted MFS family arabinose efflux permease
LVWGSLSIGAALGGLTAHQFGLRAPFFIGAAFGGVALLTLWFSITPRSLADVALADQRHAADDAPSTLDAGVS